jgi:hypothetical protein
MKPPKKDNHVLHKFHPRKTRERQSPSQRGCGEGDKFRIDCALLFLFWEAVAKFEVLEVWEEPNEIQDLPGRTSGFFEGKESKSRCEVSKAPLDVRHKAGYFEVIYSKFLDVRECGKVTQGVTAKLFGRELVEGIIIQADTESLDEWE